MHVVFSKNYMGVILGHPKPSGDTQPWIHLIHIAQKILFSL